MALCSVISPIQQAAATSIQRRLIMQKNANPFLTLSHAHKLPFPPMKGSSIR